MFDLAARIPIRPVWKSLAVDHWVAKDPDFPRLVSSLFFFNTTELTSLLTIIVSQSPKTPMLAFSHLSKFHHRLWMPRFLNTIPVTRTPRDSTPLLVSSTRQVRQKSYGRKNLSCINTAVLLYTSHHSLHRNLFTPSPFYFSESSGHH